MKKSGPGEASATRKIGAIFSKGTKSIPIHFLMKTNKKPAASVTMPLRQT
ncbi:MAG TPA: hypothetical protein VFR09_01880 [Alphaproteobacteria bacterium]|nr:hypothetical protein [Alphaproteobacteria bacterium]